MDETTNLILKSELVRDWLLKYDCEEARDIATIITYYRTQARNTGTIELSLLSGAVADGVAYLEKNRGADA